MNLKGIIEVQDKDGNVLGSIKRVLKAEQCGNFNPIYCRYKGKKCLVSSKEGDLSDPFRRDRSYLNSLYIRKEE